MQIEGRNFQNFILNYYYNVILNTAIISLTDFNMFGRDSGDVTVLCPFDNTHVILAKSLNSHLVKCRKVSCYEICIKHRTNAYMLLNSILDLKCTILILKTSQIMKSA